MRKPDATRTRALSEFDRGFLDGRSVLAGVDEAGRGPLAGPVVACAVIVKSGDFTVRIDDSKKLSARRREAAFAEITARCEVSTALAEAARIDEINIFQATLEAMRAAFFGLGRRPDVVLIDGPVAPSGLGGVRAVGVTDGDARSLSVACASIAAKVTRDRLMREAHGRYPVYGFDRHKGYGTAAHLAALKRFGPCAIHRRSFAPVANNTGVNG